jgi:hypothetical protein
MINVSELLDGVEALKRMGGLPDGQVLIGGTLAAYLAGFFDADGSVAGSLSQGYTSIDIQVTQKEKCVLEVCQMLWGGKLSVEDRRDGRAGRGSGVYYHWACPRGNTGVFLMAIFPYQLSKKKRAAALLAMGHCALVARQRSLPAESRERSKELRELLLTCLQETNQGRWDDGFYEVLERTMTFLKEVEL